MEGVDPKGFLETIREFNAAPRPDAAFNPNIHDGLRTSGPGDRQDQLGAKARPPRLYEAYGVTSGVTFTFGGLKTSNEHQGARRRRAAAIPGLFAAGARSSAASTTTTTCSAA